MIRVCAWCTAIMGQKAPYRDRSLTHGICPDCMKGLEAEATRYHNQRKEQPQC
jgi:hypothetical protein